MAHAYNNASLYDQAIQALLSVQNEGARDPLWHFRLGYAYFYGGREAESLPFFKRAYELDPKDEQAVQFIKRAEAYVHSGPPAPGTDEAEQTEADKEAHALQPFVWVVHSGSVSIILNVGDYKTDVFAERAEEGFEGNGYDWASLASVFLKEQMPELVEVVRFDPEASMFCAYSANSAALYRFAAAFKAACEDNDLIRDLFSRAELD